MHVYSLQQVHHWHLGTSSKRIEFSIRLLGSWTLWLLKSEAHLHWDCKGNIPSLLGINSTAPRNSSYSSWFRFLFTKLRCTMAKWKACTSFASPKIARFRVQGLTLIPTPMCGLASWGAGLLGDFANLGAPRQLGHC